MLNFSYLVARLFCPGQRPCRCFCFLIKQEIQKPQYDVGNSVSEIFYSTLDQHTGHHNHNYHHNHCLEPTRGAALAASFSAVVCGACKTLNLCRSANMPTGLELTEREQTRPKRKVLLFLNFWLWLKSAVPPQHRETDPWGQTDCRCY